MGRAFLLLLFPTLLLAQDSTTSESKKPEAKVGPVMELSEEKLRHIDKLATKLQMVHNRIRRGDMTERRVLGTLYSLDKSIKKMADQRKELTDRMLSVQGNVKDLAKKIVDVEKIIDGQRQQLSRRLRAIYMLGAQGVMRVLFSAQSAGDFDRNLRFLKRISKRDYELIRSYRLNLAELEGQREELQAEVRQLVGVRKKLQGQELKLSDRQKSKQKILRSLRKKKSKYIAEMQTLRKKSHTISGNEVEQSFLDMLEDSFFEKKGQLQRPIQAPVTQTYGLVQNKEYRYRLSHKGLFLQLPPVEK